MRLLSYKESFQISGNGTARMKQSVYGLLERKVRKQIVSALFGLELERSELYDPQ